MRFSRLSLLKSRYIRRKYTSPSSRKPPLLPAAARQPAPPAPARPTQLSSYTAFTTDIDFNTSDSSSVPARAPSRARSTPLPAGEPECPKTPIFGKLGDIRPSIASGPHPGGIEPMRRGRPGSTMTNVANSDVQYASQPPTIAQPPLQYISSNPQPHPMLQNPQAIYQHQQQFSSYQPNSAFADLSSLSNGFTSQQPPSVNAYSAQQFPFQLQQNQQHQPLAPNSLSPSLNLQQPRSASMPITQVQPTGYAQQQPDSFLAPNSRNSMPTSPQQMISPSSFNSQIGQQQYSISPQPQQHLQLGQPSQAYNPFPQQPHQQQQPPYLSQQPQQPLHPNPYPSLTYTNTNLSSFGSQQQPNFASTTGGFMSSMMPNNQGQGGGWGVGR